MAQSEQGLNNMRKYPLSMPASPLPYRRCMVRRAPHDCDLPYGPAMHTVRAKFVNVEHTIRARPRDTNTYTHCSQARMLRRIIVLVSSHAPQVPRALTLAFPRTAIVV